MGTTYSHFKSLKALSLVMLFASAGCLPQKPPDQSCEENFERTIASIEIKGKQKAIFAADDFDFLSNPDIKISELSLEGTVVPHHSVPKDFSFSLNGVKAGRKDGGENLYLDCLADGNNKPEDNDAKRDKTAPRNFCAPAHKFFLNGGLSALPFILKLKSQKGQVEMNLHSKNSEVLDARLVARGKIYKSCDVPPPPPPPIPVAPDTVIDAFNPSESPTAIASKSISFSSNQAGVTFHCSLNGANAAACSSPIAYSNLSSGDHSFSVYAVNAAGLADETPAVHAWSVDTVPPSVTIDNLASLSDLTASGTIAFEFSAVDAVSFSCSLDGAAASNCSSPVTYTGLGDGAHNIAINAVDAVGNGSDAPATFQWVVDQTAPVTSLVAADPAAPINNSATMVFQFAANESASFECSIDHGAFSACSSPATLNNIGEGSHWFAVRATDVAGNQGLASSYNWSSDQTAPVITIVNAIPAPGVNAAGNVSVEFAVSETATVQCSWDGAIPSDCASPFAVGIELAGEHNLVISAVDLAGNVAAPQSLSWTMDFSSPEISFGAMAPSSASFINSRDFSAEIVASENVQLYGSVNGSPLEPVSSPLELFDLLEGAYTVSVTAYDQAGNAGNTITHSFVVDVTAPVATLQLAITGTTKLDYNTMTFSADEDGTLECDIDHAGFAACVSPQALSGLADGIHEVAVRGVDAAGNVGAAVTAQWTIDSTAPMTFLFALQTGTRSMTFNLSSTEDNVSYECSYDGGAYENCGATVAIGNIEPGDHVFAARAVDGAGNVDPVGASHNYFIKSPITTSLIATVTNEFTNIKNISFTLGSNHPDATFVCSLNGAALAACSSPLSYSDLADGTYSFRVAAVDSSGMMDESGGVTHTWTVDTVVPALVGNPTIAPTSTTITINWTTNEPTTTKLIWGRDSALDKVVPEDATYVTAHTVRLTGLSANTLYSMKPAGTDRAGNYFERDVVTTVRTAR